MALDVLFYRPCKRCERGFLYCRAREPGRRYCDECAEPAKKERARKANKKYRGSPEGLEQHRDEQARWRERQQLERVGDRRLEPEEGQLQMLPTTAAYTRVGEEICDAPVSAEAEKSEWLLVAWPELLAAATWWVGSQVSCPGCGRRGVVVRVVSLDDWREEDES